MSKILIVDDSKSARTSLTFSLSLKGFEVLTAENGQLALDTLAANTTKIDLIITDINMPVMNGIELIQHLRAREEYSTMPIIVLTMDEEKGEEALELGATGFVMKSSKSSENIIRFVRTYLKM